MRKHSFFSVLAKHLMLMLFFIASCNRIPKLCENQREKISAFFEELLLEYGGAYTLFSLCKPVTIEDLVDDSDYQATVQYLDEHPDTDFVSVERRLEEGWEEWKKISPKFKLRNFRLSEIKIRGRRYLLLINIEASKRVIEENYTEFKRVLGADFDPIAGIERNKDGFWEKIFSDYQTTGTILGFGARNSAIFARWMETEAPSLDFCSSENNDPRLKAECYLNDKPFRIPVFMMLDQSESKELVKTYKEERNKIKAFYREKNFLDVTLERLWSL